MITIEQKNLWNITSKILYKKKKGGKSNIEFILSEEK